MFSSGAVVMAAAAFAGLVSAQDQSFSLTQNATGTYPYTVPATDFTATMRNTICTAQKNSCTEICQNLAYPNSCDPTTLTWSCFCSTYNTSPNITQFIQTVPYFECTQYVTNCINNAGQDLAAVTACRAVPCGSMNPAAVASVAISSSAASATATSTAAATAMAATASASATKTAAAAHSHRASSLTAAFLALIAAAAF